MRLTTPQIRALLARYEAAETTLEEERDLRAALSSPGIPEEFHAYRSWFGGLEVLASAPAPERAGPWSEDARSRGSAPGRPSEAKVRDIRRAPATPPPQGNTDGALGNSTPGQRGNAQGSPAAAKPVHGRRRVRPLWVRLAVAAALVGLLGFGASLLLQPGTPDAPIAVTPDDQPLDNPTTQQPPSTPIDWSQYEVTDPAEATRITRAALAQVSNRLRRGSALTAEHLGTMEPIHHLHNRKS